MTGNLLHSESSLNHESTKNEKDRFTAEAEEKNISEWDGELHIYEEIDCKDETSPTVKVAAQVGQLYAQVDKKKKKGSTFTAPPTLEGDPEVSQLYAQVDKKKKKDAASVAPPTIESDSYKSEPAVCQSRQEDEKHVRNTRGEVRELGWGRTA